MDLDEGAVRDRLSPPPPLDARHGLFLDFDGTLVDIVDRPDAVVLPADLADLLVNLAQRLDGRVAIVTGRSIAQIDALAAGRLTGLALAGSHGVELRDADGRYVHPDAGPALADAHDRITGFASSRGLIVERKSFGVAVHYRLAPEHGDAADGFVAEVAAALGLALQRGKMMVEARIAGGKGDAVRALMATPPFAGCTPLFLGDDVTDEDGFGAADAAGGAGVLVGPDRPSLARCAIADVPGVRAWLAQGLERMG